MNKKITVLGYPLFFILPWLSYLISLFNLKSKRSAVLFILYAAFFGYSISFSNSSADSYRYATAFLNFERPDSYLTIISWYLDGSLRDLYRISLFYVTSLFSSSPHFLYALAGLIHGFFVYLNLRLYIDEKGRQNNIYTLALGLVFITLCSITAVNGFRFNTGAMLAFYSIYQFIVKNNKLGLLGVIFTPLMHYSFFLLIPVVLILKLVLYLNNSSQKINPIFFYMFITTALLSFFLDTNIINISSITSSDLLPSAASNRLDYINSDDVVDIYNSRAESSLFLRVNNSFETMITIYVIVVVIYIKRLLKRSSLYLPSINYLFSFTLLYYTFAFIALSFPSGNRFMSMAHLLLIILLIKSYNQFKTTSIKYLMALSILPFLFKIFFINFLLPYMILTPTFWYGGFLGVTLENLNATIY